MTANRIQAAGVGPRLRTQGVPRPARPHGRRLYRIACAAALALAAMPPAALPSAAQDSGQIRLAGPNRTTVLNVVAGKSQDVRTEESFTDITVGDPEIADVHPLTDRTLSILGKKVGTTRVSVYGEGRKLVGIVDVEVGYETSRLAAELKRRFPQAALTVTSVNGRLMLSGEAPDAPTVDQAVMIARQFVPDVINSISVKAPQQVMLEVRFVEASRRASRELGVQWNRFGRQSTVNIGARRDPRDLPLVTSDPAGYTHPSGIPLQTATGIAGGVLSGGAPFGFMIGRIIGEGFGADVMINALEQKGMARTLAEPNLVALSGDTASFLAGGEFPIPVPGALGQVTIEYKRYGVGLAFTPTVLRDGVINLKIEPEVSQLDMANPVQVAGISVPPLIVRRASTTIELRDGQSFVIGGLLQNRNTNDQQQLPWIGEVPVLGALFRSTSYQNNETDLAIIVTPRIVRPARPGDPIRTPLDATLPPNDVELFLLGKTEVPRGAALGQGANHLLVGHIIDLPQRGSHVVRARN